MPDTMPDTMPDNTRYPSPAPHLPSLSFPSATPHAARPFRRTCASRNAQERPCPRIPTGLWASLPGFKSGIMPDTMPDNTRYPCPCPPRACPSHRFARRHLPGQHGVFERTGANREVQERPSSRADRALEFPLPAEIPEASGHGLRLEDLGVFASCGDPRRRPRMVCGSRTLEFPLPAETPEASAQRTPRLLANLLTIRTFPCRLEPAAARPDRRPHRSIQTRRTPIGAVGIGRFPHGT